MSVNSDESICEVHSNDMGSDLHNDIVTKSIKEDKQNEQSDISKKKQLKLHIET